MTRDPQAVSPPFNLYTEEDMGRPPVLYPDGSVRFVATRKVRDTVGVSFYVFDSATPLK